MNEGRIVIIGWADSVHVQRWSRSLAERGWAVRVVSLGGEPIDGIDTVIIPRRSAFTYLTQSNAAVQHVQSFNPDIVHVHYAGGPGFWGLRCGIHPLVVSVWGSDIVDLPRRIWSRMLVRRVLTKADWITATSEALRQSTLAVLPEAAGKITTIPFGVDVPPSPAPMPEDPVRLCYTKNHKPIYGLDLLIRALPLVRSQIPDIRLTVAGTGATTEQYKALARELDLDDIVDFVGHVDNRRMFSLLRDHHIMVMPSLSESFGVAALEAAACARPVIASRVGGVPEVVEDGVTGMLLPPGDITALAGAIKKLATDLPTCERMGLAGYDLVRERYSCERSLDMMIDVYRKVRHG